MNTTDKDYICKDCGEDFTYTGTGHPGCCAQCSSTNIKEY